MKKFDINFCKHNKVAIKVETKEQIEKLQAIVNPIKPESWRSHFSNRYTWYIRLDNNDTSYDFSINTQNYVGIYYDKYEIIDYNTFIEHNKQETMEKFPTKWYLKGSEEFGQWVKNSDKELKYGKK